MSGWRCAYIVFACLVTVVGRPVIGLAGGGPRNVLIVVNDRSLESLELGNYYRAARGIPERNVCHIDVPAAVPGFFDKPALRETRTLSEAEFIAKVRNPVAAHIAQSGLSNQIDYVVFSRDIPHMVEKWNGMTSAMFYGYKSSPVSPMEPDTENLYYAAERAFTRQEMTNDYYLSTMLTGWTLAEAKALVDCGTAADETHPVGTVYLTKSTDAARNVRYQQFDNLHFLRRFMPDLPVFENIYASYITGKTNVMGYLGSKKDILQLDSNTYLPGAMADHLTSYGGQLFYSSQMSILDFIREGICGSHGTVAEPWNFLEKFPSAMSYFWYARGFSLAESYWMSVKNPYMGIFVGEPLAAPYAVRPLVSVTNPPAGQIVSNTVLIDVWARGADAGQTVSRVDWLVDGLWAGTVSNVPPAPGNRVTAAIGGTLVVYAVKPADTL